MKTILTKLTVMSVVLFSALIQAQVGVGTTTPQGALDVSSSDSGMLVPRVSLTSVLVAAPVLNPQGGGLATGTLVYNTATAGVSPNNVVPGFYYWDGTRWVSISGGSVAAPTNAWELTGNAGTDSNVNFIGTTDAQDFVIRANGSSKFRIAHGTNQILSTQNGAISSPTYSWEAAPNYGFYMAAGTNIRVATNGVNRLQFPNAAQIHAMADGTALLPFYSWTNAPSSGMFKVGNTTNAQLGFSTAGAERMRITQTGSVGIGTDVPEAALDITSSNNGFVAPRIGLTALNVSAPVVNPNGGGAPLAGTIVYNTATAGTAPNDVTPGYYYWNGTQWVRMEGGGAAPANAWNLTGNAGTNPTNNFVGTTDNVDFRVRTNNAERFNFTNNGRLRAYDNGTEAQPTYSWNGDDNTGIWRPAADNLAFSTNGAERMRILQDGTVGIGGTRASTKLNVEVGNNANGIYSNATTSGSWAFYGVTNQANGVGAVFQNTDTSGVAMIATTGTAISYLPGAGATINGVGITAGASFGPNTGFSGVGNSSTESYTYPYGGGGVAGTGLAGIFGYTTDLINGWAGYFDGDLGVMGAGLATDGFWTASDKRVKKNFRDIGESIEIIKKLRPVKYEKNISVAHVATNVKTGESKKEYRDADDITEFGLIAQEIELILPELVSEKKMDIKGFGEIDLKSVNYVGLVPILIKSMQEQQEVIEKQSERIEKLEAMVKQILENRNR